MKKLTATLCCIGALLGFAGFASAADQTWRGQISDSMCGASHTAMMSAHKGAKMTHRSCTKVCITAGAKYVFVTNGKVYAIANQDFSKLPTEAGHTVQVSGQMNGDSITVSKMTAPGRQVEVPASRS